MEGKNISTSLGKNKEKIYILKILLWQHDIILCCQFIIMILQLVIAL